MHVAGPQIYQSNRQTNSFSNRLGQIGLKNCTIVFATPGNLTHLRQDINHGLSGRLSSAQIFEYEVERKNCGGVQAVLALLCLKDVTTKQ